MRRRSPVTRSRCSTPTATRSRFLQHGCRRRGHQLHAFEPPGRVHGVLDPDDRRFAGFGRRAVRGADVDVRDQRGRCGGSRRRASTACTFDTMQGPTVLQEGPDGRLYVANAIGEIRRYDLDPTTGLPSAAAARDRHLPVPVDDPRVSRSRATRRRPTCGCRGAKLGDEQPNFTGIISELTGRESRHRARRDHGFAAFVPRPSEQRDSLRSRRSSLHRAGRDDGVRRAGPVLGEPSGDAAVGGDPGRGRAQQSGVPEHRQRRHESGLRPLRGRCAAHDVRGRPPQPVRLHLRVERPSLRPGQRIGRREHAGGSGQQPACVEQPARR